MVTWPIPSIARKVVPQQGEPGSFWEARGDRRHCGIDLYATEGAAVVAIRAGTVVETGIATSPEQVPYWKRTCSVLIRDADGYIWRYAELSRVCMRLSDRISEGGRIGSIGSVIDRSKVTADAPAYIRSLVEAGHHSMLHIEVYTCRPVSSPAYSGGNWMGDGMPEGLIDPTPFLMEAALKR